jgi:formylglycine-generating enzyme required for sulfatase activity
MGLSRFSDARRAAACALPILFGLGFSIPSEAQTFPVGGDARSERKRRRQEARRMMTQRRSLLLFCSAALFFLSLTAPCLADKRVALIIGNGAYKHTSALTNPPNDASDVAEALKAVGFDVTLKTDIDKRQMDEAVAQFARDGKGADALLFYYAGHGMQFQGKNFLMPVDAELQDEVSLHYEMVGFDDVKAAMQLSRGVKIIVLDACRNNPLAETFVRSISLSTRDVQKSRGFAPMEKAQGMMVVYATQADDVAQDGAGRNSPFSAAFLKEIKEPGLEVGTMFRRIGSDVYAATEGHQSPEMSISMLPEYYLNQSETDQTTWARIRTGANAGALREFLDRYPDSFYAPDARAKLDLLDREARDQAGQDAGAGTHSPGAAAETAKIASGGAPSQPGASHEAMLSPVPPPPAPPAPSPAAPTAPPPAKPAGKTIAVGPPPGIAPNDPGGEVFKECEECPEMVVIPAGKAMLGSPLGESGRQTFEAAPHPVEVAKPFAVGRYAVSFAEWDSCFAEGACGHRRLGDLDFGRGRHPAIFATWTEVQLYVEWLKRKTGQSYRLLSEAEWEYAARGCRDVKCAFTPFWFGAIKPELAVYDSRRSYDGSPKAVARLKTEPVDSGSPNPFGLYNMLGNVRQWTEDCWNPTPAAGPSNGAAVLSGDCTARATRGGSWADGPAALRAAARDYESVDEGSERIGFRVARDLSP